MAYAVRFSDAAAADYDKLPLPLQNFVDGYIHQVAVDPVGLGGPSRFPFPPGCKTFHFDHPDFDGERHDFTLLFRFQPTLGEVQIVGIGHQVRHPAPPSGQP
ncbi:MAG: hypothetical protein JNM56_39775 [Planctomycetia bacterium]|nr:hypothetical protein [Planctomycetia bacterium]